MRTDGPPLVSIVSVVYNDARGLARTIASVAAQTFKDFEYIVIDGRSTDGTVDVIREHAAKIDQWVSEPDEGISDAFNKGIARARGHWLYFLNAGDVLSGGDALAQVAPVLANEQHAQIVYGKIEVVEAEGAGLYEQGRPFNANRFRQEMSLPHQGLFMKRTFFDKHGLFDTSYRLAMDYELLLRAWPFEPVYVPVVLAKMTAGGVSQQRVWRVYGEFKRAKLQHGTVPTWRAWWDFGLSVLRYYLSPKRAWRKQLRGSKAGLL